MTPPVVELSYDNNDCHETYFNSARTATITVYSADGTKSAACTVTVKAPPTLNSVSFSKTKVTVGENVTITLSHEFGTAEGTIEVISADTGYIIGWVAAPLFTEILLIALIAAYIIRYFTKPRFAQNAVIYIGRLSFVDEGSPKHKILRFQKVNLNQYNKFKYLWNPFKPLTAGPDSALLISVSAAKGSKIVCNENFPWYIAAELESKERSKLDRIDRPADL